MAAALEAVSSCSRAARFRSRRLGRDWRLGGGATEASPRTWANRQSRPQAHEPQYRYEWQMRGSSGPWGLGGSRVLATPRARETGGGRLGAASALDESGSWGLVSGSLRRESCTSPLRAICSYVMAGGSCGVRVDSPSSRCLIDM